MLPERTTIEFYEPMTGQITDSYGETIVLSRIPDKGDILSVSVERTSQGGYARVTLAGNFHTEDRQNLLNFLERLAGMQERSELETQECTLLLPHPQMFVRGYVRNLESNHKSTPAPLFFNFSFDFEVSQRPRQPVAMGNPGEAIAQEGRPYVTLTVPAGITDLRDLLLAYFGKRYTDVRRIREVIRYNRFRPSQVDGLLAGQEVLVPIL